ncbi:MAG: LPS export ABC transporter periplasmic protein LptC [Xanthomonadales bacterium]|nr:LPS export ABC transporter periplasmic protein LptC [Xanthomonadales bacterium]
MIRRKTSLGILALATLVALTYWAARMKTERVSGPIAGLDTRLDYALRDFELRFYDERGEPAARLTAPVLANQAASGIGEITRPEFDIMHRGNVWHIVAQSATIGPDREQVSLNGDVRMRRTATLPGRRLELATTDMLLEVTRRLVSGEQAVRIEDGADTLRARGFQVNLANDHFTLMDDVQLTYAAN